MLGYTFLALVSGCRGNNVYFALSAPRQDRELDEPLSRILFVLLGDLRVDSSNENVPFRLWESATKRGHSFGTFSGYPVVLVVKSRIYVISHYTKVSEIYHEELECPTAIR